MDTLAKANTPTKSALFLRLFIILALSCGSVELLELMVESYLDVSEFVMELIEFGITLSILTILARLFVVNPIYKEMGLRIESEQLVAKSEYKFRNMIESLPDAVLQISAEGVVIDYIPKHIAYLNFKVGSNICDSMPSDKILDFLQHIKLTLTDGKSQHIDYKFIHCSETHYLVFNIIKSGDREVTIFIRDITRRKTYEEQLEFISTHDVLTGLYNRTFYEAELDRLSVSRRYPVSIIVLDLDNLKITNDTYGHAAGDKMICKAANTLKNAFRSEDMIARTGVSSAMVIFQFGGYVRQVNLPPPAPN